MGTPALAAHILERIVMASGANFRVVGVVTRPDKPRGRGLGTEPSEVGAIAAKHQIPTLKPSKIRTSEFLSELKAFEPDLLRSRGVRTNSAELDSRRCRRSRR